MMNAWTKLRSALRNFRVARGGNVAITFAFATIPVIGAIGAGFDYSHANSVKADLQAALNSTALMLAKNAATLSNGDLQTKARNYFTALFNRPEATIDGISATYTASAGSQVVVNGSVDVPTTFLRVLGTSVDANNHRERLVHHKMGHLAPARGAGARQYRVDGRRRQDHRVEERDP